MVFEKFYTRGFDVYLQILSTNVVENPMHTGYGLSVKDSQSRLRGEDDTFLTNCLKEYKY